MEHGTTLPGSDESGATVVATIVLDLIVYIYGVPPIKIGV